MKAKYSLSAKENIHIKEQNGTGVVVESPVFSWPISPLSPGSIQALEKLSDRWLNEDELLDIVTQVDGSSESMINFMYMLKHMEKAGIFQFRIASEELEAVLVPANSSFILKNHKIDPDTPYRISRFAYLHRVGDKMLLECPLASARLELKGWKAAAVFAALGQSKSLNQVLESIPGLSRHEVNNLFIFLLNLQALETEDETGEKKPEKVALDHWEFHDAVFHYRSRFGRHDQPFGGTYRLKGKHPATPALQKREALDSIELFKPDLEKLKETDISLTQALESRKSIRAYSSEKLHIDQIGEFLYRSARIKGIRDTGIEEVVAKPFPSGGSIYELELWLIVKDCEGVGPGLYHYAADAHRLDKIAEASDASESLLMAANLASKNDCTPQVLFVITTRHQRIAWKYQTLAYALTLKHVGVLYQTMYLVATSMGLAPCGLGGGNSDKFAAASGLDYFTETSVGEFMLGTHP